VSNWRSGRTWLHQFSSDQPILRWIPSARAAGVTKRLRLIAIRLAATEFLPRGSLLGDVHDSSVAADGHSLSTPRTRTHGPCPARIGSDDTLLHIATTSFSDHSIRSRLHHRLIAPRFLHSRPDIAHRHLVHDRAAGEEFPAQVAAATPLGRTNTPDEIAVVRFLAVTPGAQAIGQPLVRL
jgi:hypothetical protein